MKRIAVMGGGEQAAAAKLIGTMLERSTGWRVGVAEPSEPPSQAWSRLEQSGFDWGVAPVTGAEGLKSAQVGVVTRLKNTPLQAVTGCPRLVLNLDDPGCRQLAEEGGFDRLTYSEHRDNADLTAKALRLFPNRTEFVALTWDQIRRVRLPVYGGYNVYQGLAALGCGLSLGLTLETMAPTVEQVAPLPGILEPFPLEEPFQVILDKTSSPEGLEGLLLTLRPMAGREGKLRVLVSRENREAVELCRDLADQVIAPSGEDFSQRRAALETLLSQGEANDVIAVTGCHRPGTPGDEREILRRWQKTKKQKDRKG